MCTYHEGLNVNDPSVILLSDVYENRCFCTQEGIIHPLVVNNVIQRIIYSKYIQPFPYISDIRTGLGMIFGLDT